MFGPYEIDCDGRKYFGNVSLREFHTFAYAGNTYLVDVQGPSAQAVDPGTASLLDRLAPDCGALLPEALMQKLRGLKIVAGEEDEPVTPEAAAETQAPPAKPEFAVANIGLFLAQECNMRCLYCYGEAGEYAGSGLMDEDTAKRAVDWLIANSGSEKRIGISFFGGEPLLNFPLLRKVVAYSREKAAEKGKEMSFGMTTNGSLLTDEIIAYLDEENIFPTISFDGPPEYQDRQRPFKDGSGSHAQVKANVAKLRKVLPRVTGRATLLENAEPLRIREGMREAGFTSCFLVQASPVLLQASGGDLAADESGQRLLERMQAFNRQEALELLLAIRERKIDKNNHPAALSGLILIASGQKRYHGCGIGKGFAGITVNGDIYPCHRFAGLEDMRLGNIADYRSGVCNDYHRSIVDSLPECMSCWARYYCGGGCFYLNKATRGDMRLPWELDCRERKAMYESLIHVYCQLDEADKEYVKEILKEATPEEARPSVCPGAEVQVGV